MTTIGKRVTYSKRGSQTLGKVVDEVSQLEEFEDEDFLDLIQYIQWDDGGHSIRICYYIREHGGTDKDWIFANRPLSINAAVLESLLRRASRKGWLRSS